MRKKTPDFRKAWFDPPPPICVRHCARTNLDMVIARGFFWCSIIRRVQTGTIEGPKWEPARVSSMIIRARRVYDSTSPVPSATARPATRGRHMARMQTFNPFSLVGPRVDTKTNTRAPAHCCSNNIVVDVRSV